ncbi:MAG: hypothetical protein LBM73_02860 [Candidatus Nomurabacteria bacterium]|nr:hypothetical protein [Candidatus Nomurabacteria bacterium]
MRPPRSQPTNQSRSYGDGGSEKLSNLNFNPNNPDFQPLAKPADSR